MERPHEALVTLDNVTKTYALFDSKLQRAANAILARSVPEHRQRRALSDISLTIGKGEMLGILGLNGAGKSTLLQVITGVLKPSSGTVDVTGHISALLELGAGFNPEWTGRENARFSLQISGIDASRIDPLIDEIEAFADVGIYFDQPVRTYSSGMFVRVAFAAAIMVDPEILIVDEALAVGDARFQNKCYNRISELREKGTTIILVTHSMDAVIAFCDRAIVLEGGTLTFDGTPKDAAGYYMGLLYGHAREDVSDEVEEPALPSGESALLPDAAPDTAENFEQLFEELAKVPQAQRGFINPEGKRVGTGNAKIEDIAFLANGKLCPSGAINSGDLVEVILRVRAREDIEEPAIGVKIKSVDDVQIDLSASNMQGISHGPLKKGETGYYKVSWRARLAGGDYFVDLGFAEVQIGTHRTDDWRISIVQFSVAATPHHLGPAHLAIRMTGQ